jgi:hypothetical protein
MFTLKKAWFYYRVLGHEFPSVTYSKGLMKVFCLHLIIDLPQTEAIDVVVWSVRAGGMNYGLLAPACLLCVI